MFNEAGEHVLRFASMLHKCLITTTKSFIHEI